ncbi:DUF308 domain-containing protein [Sphingomonas crusticola]|uniref:DUF308 domain-containing protein n=1 Tax=Sphingomonas crusticola TaxID=1697973 RepID=UPI000E26B444|nr:DUF308 domain-containing protein [Sphingomonas crusticola]
MTAQVTIDRPSASSASLRNYYFTRGLVAAGWVAGAFTIGKDVPAVAAILLVAYPAWDAAANLIDARRSGGLARNRSQTINAVVSGIAALAILASLNDTIAVVAIFGAWAIVAGLLQLATGLRRWKSYGAQWTMLLSGAQSALAGGFFIRQALGAPVHGITDVAPYAAFGAFYFLVSALWLTVRRGR